MMNKDVLVVIVSYMHDEILDLCLSHLASQTYPNIDIAVWDNGSSSVRLKDKYSNVKFMFSEDNILWSPAVNRCIEQNLKSNHGYILVMNHDILLPPVAIERLVCDFDLAEHDPGIIAPAGSAMGGLQDYISNRTLPPHQDWATDLQESIKDFGLTRATYCVGAVQMIKRELYDLIGGLDEEMPLGADDFDYSIRAKEAGFSIWIAYNIYVNHFGHITSGADEWNEFGALSWKRFNEKYNGYFASEQEAIGALWGATYNSEYSLGTGISVDQKINRGILNVPK